jgi:hypothetical protein
MAKPNYAFAKRQRDLAKKQKKEEKKLRKAGSGTEGSDNSDTSADQTGADVGEQTVEQGAGQGGQTDREDAQETAAGEVADVHRA